MSRASPEAAPQSDDHVFYPVKWILDGQNASVPICMQARNGPCALLALVNVNLQARTFTLEPGTTRMREDHLMAILADFVSTRPPTGNEAPDTLREHAVADFLDLLPKLNRGMDINVRFNSPTSFEFTRELGVFDIFPAVRLWHGWLVDPQDVRLASALGTLSYNQVSDELVRTATPPPALPPEELDVPESDLDALVHTPSAPPIEAFDLFAHEDSNDSSPAESSSIDNIPLSIPNTAPLPEESDHTTAIREIRPFVMDFLESNPTQLTVYGLTELHSALTEDERGILFRNSHFYVIQKRASELYTLVTDVGYLNELNTVWEKLSDINGDSTFYNGSFQRINVMGDVAGGTPAQPAPTIGQRPQQQAPPPPPPPTGSSVWAQNPYGNAGPSQRPQQRPVRTSGVHGRKGQDKCVVQ